MILGKLVAIGLALAALAGAADASTILDFVTLDGIDYVRWPDEPGRALTRADLGIEFATIECAIGDDSRRCAYGVDAAAAFIPAGSRMYAIRGYTTEFRLAAIWQDRIFLYQAWRNPRAKVGGDLLDIAGKVRAIEVQRDAETPAAAANRVAVTSPEDTAMLLDMIVRGAMRPPSAHPVAEPRYWVTFWLNDGTTLGRPYFADTSELMGGVVLPAGFRAILDRYLR
jgi:hypothetical protein